MKKQAKIILSVCLVLLLTLGIGGYVYVSDCYGAQDGDGHGAGRRRGHRNKRQREDRL